MEGVRQNHRQEATAGPREGVGDIVVLGDGRLGSHDGCGGDAGRGMQR